MRALLVPFLMLSTACYQNAPVDVAVRPLATGERIALEVSDAGRQALAERFGQGVSEIEGALLAAPDATYNLSVFRVSYLRAAQSQWAGERVTVERAHVGQVFRRSLDRRRTTLAAVAVGGGLLALILTRELVISGRERDPGTDGQGPDQVRLPLFTISR